MDLFVESKTYLERKRKEGVLTFFEPFLYMTSDREYETGFFVVKGAAPEIFRLMEEKDYLLLVEKAMASSSTSRLTSSPLARGSPSR